MPLGVRAQPYSQGPFDSLMFYQDLILSAEIFFFILNAGGRWVATFWFFKSLHINMVYTLDVYVDIQVQS